MIEKHYKSAAPAAIYVKGEYPEEVPAVRFSPDFWYKGQLSHSGDDYQYIIDEAVRSSDARALEFAGTKGRDENFSLVIRDHSGLSDSFQTSFFIEFEKKYIEQNTKLSGHLSSNLIEQKNNQFKLKIGMLPLYQQYYKSGSGFSVVIKARRVFGTFSTEYLVLRKHIRNLEKSSQIDSSPSVSAKPVQNSF